MRICDALLQHLPITAATDTGSEVTRYTNDPSASTDPVSAERTIDSYGRFRRLQKNHPRVASPIAIKADGSGTIVIELNDPFNEIFEESRHLILTWSLSFVTFQAVKSGSDGLAPPVADAPVLCSRTKPKNLSFSPFFPRPESDAPLPSVSPLNTSSPVNAGLVGPVIGPALPSPCMLIIYLSVPPSITVMFWTPPPGTRELLSVAT